MTASPDLFGHPRGIWVLAATEFWDRVSFHGMQSLLVLYMAESLLTPAHIGNIVGFATFRGAIECLTGPLSVRALATQVFGLYVAFVYLTPMLGGFLGDVVLGRRRAVALGALLMTAGHFCMAFDQSFLLALACLILGAGLFRGNLSPQFGELYDPVDQRRDTAFQIYGAMVNLGAFIAPLTTGALGQAFGWHMGFAFAGFGMLIGLAIYLLGAPMVRPHPDLQRRPEAKDQRELSAQDRRVLTHLVLMIPMLTMFWVAQSQVWNTYNLWARDHVELRFGGWTMPVPWLQSLDGLSPFILLPPVLLYWRRQAAAGREPRETTKMAIGCFIFSLSTFWLAGASAVTDHRGLTPLWWPVIFHLSSNLGWLFFSPTTSALYSRLAPPGLTATLMGAATVSVFLGSLISGRMGVLYETLTPGQFWGLHAALVGLGGMLLLLMGARLRRIGAQA